MLGRPLSDRTRPLLLIVALATCGCPRTSDLEAPPTVAPRGSLGQATTVPSASTASSAAPAASTSARPAASLPIPLPRAGGPRAVRAEAGLVTSVDAEATRAGVAILEAGGNAVDAAVAVAFALAVTHPSAGNLGGGGFILARPPGGPTVAVDFRESSPRALTRSDFDAMIAGGGGGPVSVGVPGTVAGLLATHERFGRLPRPRVLEPAIRLARSGHRVSNRTALTLSWSWPTLKRDPAARTEFGAPSGPLPARARWVRRNLANTLERIAADGARGFYEGAVSAAIAARLSGHLGAADLAQYRARFREPLRFGYRGLVVETMPPPSAGGVALAVLLLELQRQRVHALDGGSALAIHLFLEASRRAQAERRLRVVDPDRLAPEVLARRIAEWTDPDHPIPGMPLVDRSRATPSPTVHPLYAASLRETEHTTHFSVVDAEGMVASCTVTLSDGFGAKIVVPGTGVVLNNAVASFASVGENLPEPGRRTTSSMAPTLVLADNRPVLVLGSPGGDTIPSTIAQILRRMVDGGMTIDEAIDAPRVHHGFVPDAFRFEAARPIPQAVLQELCRMGHTVSQRRLPIGDANNISLAEGAAWGYADPREGGLALAAASPPTAQGPSTPNP